MPLTTYCVSCDDERDFISDPNPTEDELTRQAEDVPRINLQCEDCGHELRLFDSGIVDLF
jgi:hypothetical protein